MFLGTISEMQPGTKINLTIWRDGAKKTLTATLDSRPDNFFYFAGPEPSNPPCRRCPPAPFGNGFPGLPADSPRVGFEGEPDNGQLADFFGVKQGVLVRSVNPDTPASRAGLKAGDVVTRVNGTPVTSPREITGLVRISGKKELSFTVVRNKKEMIAESRSCAKSGSPATGATRSSLTRPGLTGLVTCRAETRPHTRAGQSLLL